LKEDEENIIECKLRECEADLYKLLKIVLVELKLINGGTEKPIIERPTFRIKGAESIRRKILSKDHINLENFTIEMKDILGIRVICRNLSSLESVYKILRQSTEIEIFEDMEKRWIEESDNGYRGIHLVFTAKAGTLRNSELKGEIQLRTIAQHYWATFSHHDIYKEKPTLLYSEDLRIKSLSDYLYLIDKELDSLGFDIKSDPFAINQKTLYSLFQKLGKNISNKDTEIFLDMISGVYKKANGNLDRDRFGNKNILSINEALISEKNKKGIDLSQIREWTNLLYNFVFERNANEIEMIFCRLYAYFEGFYWPKRRLFEYILSLKTEYWNNLLGSNSTKNLVTLLEASVYENIEKHSYYHSNFESQEEEPFFSKYNDSDLICNRGVESLSEVELLTVKLNENVKVYPDTDNFSYKKDTYQIKCTSKGRNISLEIIGKLFPNSSSLKTILDDLETEDFPQPSFPYENPLDWGFQKYTVEIHQLNRKETGKRLNFNKEDWWTDEPGYY
jgi:ppGpp synthetase/RelA/SpoT-type nucleotidyltranferase